MYAFPCQRDNLIPQKCKVIMGIIRYIGKEIFVISVLPQMDMPQVKIIKIINASCLVFGLSNAHFTGRSHYSYMYCSCMTQ